LERQLLSCRRIGNHCITPAPPSTRYICEIFTDAQYKRVKSNKTRRRIHYVAPAETPRKQRRTGREDFPIYMNDYYVQRMAHPYDQRGSPPACGQNPVRVLRARDAQGSPSTRGQNPVRVLRTRDAQGSPPTRGQTARQIVGYSPPGEARAGTTGSTTYTKAPPGILRTGYAKAPPGQRQMPQAESPSGAVSTWHEDTKSCITD